VTGMQQAAAQQKLASVGLNNVTTQPDAQSTQPQGQVDHMTPAGGTYVDPNTQITLFVSGGGVQVPSVIGDTAVQAQQILIGQGFQVTINVDPAPPGQPVPPGTVWSQNPAANTAKPSGSTVQIFVQPQASPSPTVTPTSSPTTSQTPTDTASPTTGTSSPGHP